MNNNYNHFAIDVKFNAVIIAYIVIKVFVRYVRMILFWKIIIVFR